MTSSRPALVPFHILQNVALIALALVFAPLVTFIAIIAQCISSHTTIGRAVKHDRQQALLSKDHTTRIVLVTGVGMSKGLSIARAFYRQGHTVIAADFEPYMIPVCGRFSNAIHKFYRLQKPTGEQGSGTRYVEGIIDIISDEATIGPLAMGATADATFTINADRSIAHNKSIDFFVETYSDSDIATSYTYGFESDSEGWTSFDAADNGISNPWWHSSEAILHSKLPKESNSGNGHLMSETLEKSLLQYSYPIDNYLVSPQKFKITDNSTFSFYARAHHDSYYQEHFGVAVSTNSNTSENDFNTIQEWTIEKSQGTTWNKYTVDLSQYDGEEIYIAIRHFFTQAEWESENIADYGYGVDALNIDDIVLSGVSTSTHHTPTYDENDPNYFTIIINNMIDLDAPQNLTATAQSISEIDLAWDVVAEATEYNLYRDGVRIATLKNNSYHDINLTHNTEYCYEVAAVYYGTEFEHAQACATTKQKDLSIDVTYHSPEIIYMGVNDGTLTITIVNDGANEFPARGYYTIACDDQYVSIGTDSYTLYPASFTPGTKVTETFNFTIDSSIPNNHKLTFYARFDSGGTQENEIYNLAVPIEIIVKNDPNIPRNLRVIDYKTGERKLSFGSVEELFSGEHDSSAAFQVVLYSLLISHDLKQQVQPEVYQISKMNGQNHRSEIAIQKSTVHYIDSTLDSEFIDNLSSAIFKPMLDVEKKFEPTDKIKRCELCDYKNLCNR